MVFKIFYSVIMSFYNYNELVLKWMYTFPPYVHMPIFYSVTTSFHSLNELALKRTCSSPHVNVPRVIRRPRERCV